MVTISTKYRLVTRSDFDGLACAVLVAALALWEWGTEPESNAVTTLVRRLRQRLEVVGAKDWLETVYGMGYRLNPKSENVQ